MYCKQEENIFHSSFSLHLLFVDFALLLFHFFSRGLLFFLSFFIPFSPSLYDMPMQSVKFQYIRHVRRDSLQTASVHTTFCLCFILRTELRNAFFDLKHTEYYESCNSFEPKSLSSSLGYLSTDCHRMTLLHLKWNS